MGGGGCCKGRRRVQGKGPLDIFSLAPSHEHHRAVALASQGGEPIKGEGRGHGGGGAALEQGQGPGQSEGPTGEGRQHAEAAGQWAPGQGPYFLEFSLFVFPGHHTR